jgi:hypothetical protein
MATSFKLLTLRPLKVRDIPVTVPERPLTETVDPTEADWVPLTVIPLDEVKVCADEGSAKGSNKLARASTRRLSFRRENRNRTTARAETYIWETSRDSR